MTGKMVSEGEIVERLREILSTSDLNTTTNSMVRRKLEEDFGIDLSDKKAFVREQIDFYLHSQFENHRDDNDAEGDGRLGNEGGDVMDDYNEEEENKESSGVTRSTRKRSRKKNKEVKKRGGGGGFTKLCGLSPQLQKFIGVSELARTEVVKQLWSHIKENNLQDPNNRRNILCDDTLHDLFGVDTIDMFQMNKVLSKHIWPLETDGAALVDSTPKEKHRKQDAEDELMRKEKKQKVGGSGILAPVPLSDALVKFLGTGESALPRSDVIKRIWQYIKLNDLQDPSDKRRIICDQKLKELFDVDTFNGFTVSKLLTVHFIKLEH